MSTCIGTVEPVVPFANISKNAIPPSLQFRIKAAITLLYNFGQNSQHSAEFPEYKMNDWAAHYLHQECEAGVDFILLSYHGHSQDCSEVTKSVDQLVRVFS